MNEIVMIPVEQLTHHPQNPRLDLGDLDELTESIRTQGVLQNLTVISGHWRSKEEFLKDCRAEGVTKDVALDMFDRENSWTPVGYTVLIGNRRMEAAKRAGLKALPCVIVEMDEKDQIATMLTENMHRADLTVYEQAQGVQMMMDLGLTEAQISDMTGFSRTTVKRRVKMAELDKELLKKACAQLSMDDMDRLGKISDINKRNELLKEAGTNNFKWKIENAITEQKREDNYKQVRAILLQAGCIEKETRGIQNFWQEYEYLPYSTTVQLDKYTAGENVLPEDERQLYFNREYSGVRFWAEKIKEAQKDDEEPDEEEAARQEDTRKAREAWAALEEIEKHARESRDSFIADLSVKQKDSRKALEWMIQALVVTNNAENWINEILPDYEEEELDQLPEGHTETDLDLKYIRVAINEAPTTYAEVMGCLFFDGEDSVQNRWRKDEKPKYCRNLAMITGYEWLEAFGYQVSDDERGYLDGTLDCFKEAGT